MRIELVDYNGGTPQAAGYYFRREKYLPAPHALEFWDTNPGPGITLQYSFKFPRTSSNVVNDGDFYKIVFEGKEQQSFLSYYQIFDPEMEKLWLQAFSGAGVSLSLDEKIFIGSILGKFNASYKQYANVLVDGITVFGGSNGIPLSSVGGGGGSGGGTIWYFGAGVPGGGTGVDGDFFLNTTNGDVYEKAAGSWSVIFNIKGTNGTNGTNGSTIVPYPTPVDLGSSDSINLTTIAGLGYNQITLTANGANNLVRHVTGIPANQLFKIKMGSNGINWINRYNTDPGYLVMSGGNSQILNSDDNDFIILASDGDATVHQGGVPHA